MKNSAFSSAVHMYCTSLKNTIIRMILFKKYFIDRRRDACLNLFWEYKNRKLFAV